MTGLKQLSLRDTQITDAGPVHLEGMARLEWFYLNKTQIAGVGLEHLEGMINLRVV